MKRKWLLGLLIIAVLNGMVFAILLLNNPDMFRKKDIEDESDPKPPTYIEWWVDLSPVTEMCTFSGNVISGMPEYYIEMLVLENYKEDKLELKKKKGDTATPGDKIYVYNGKETTVDYNAQVVEVVYETTGDAKTLSIQLLNYDKLYAMVAVDTDHIDRIRYDTPVTVKIGKQKYAASVLDIGYEVIGEQVLVKLSIPTHVRPGTAIDAEFTTGTHEGMTMWTDYVYQDMSGQYYVKRKTNTGYERVDVEVGEFFSIEEDGKIWDFVEVTSGISEGDILLTEMYNSNRQIEDLKESLKK